MDNDKLQKYIEWGIAHPNERNELRRRQRALKAEQDRQYDEMIK
jgi:hypothetical protein